VVQGDVRFAVRAGQSWSSRAPAARGSSQLRPADQQLLEGAVSEGPREQVRVESPVESQGGAAGEVTVRADGVELGPTPLTWQAPVGRHHLVGTQQDRRAEAFSVTSPGAPAQVLLAMIAPEPVRPPAPPPVPAPKIVPVPEPVSAPRPVLAARPSAPKRPPAPPPEAPVQAVPAPVPEPVPEPTPAPKPPEDRRYAAAVALARGGDHAEAAKALEALVEGGGAHADLALYELGRQKQRHLGDLAGADAAFRRYRATYPQGSLAQEVELSLIELEVARGRRDDALADLPRFLAAHPDSERAPEMQLLRATLLRQKGDCEAALAAYEGLARTPQVASEALYFTAWCQRKLGRADDAERSLRRYLTLYPKDAHAAEAAEALQAR
jgi:TolA-binding protein